MPINITDGFNLNYSAPVDYRMTTANSTTRIAIAYKYDGMRTFQLDTRTNYIWNGSSSSWDIEGLNNITGSGTLNYVPKFTSSNQLGISSIYVNSDKIGINTNNPQANLQIGSSPVAYGLSLPLTIDKGLIATIGYNWYSNGFTDLYFDSSKGSSQIKFHEGTIAFATRIGGGGLKNNMVILPEGSTYKGSVVFTDAVFTSITQTPTILPSYTKSAMIRSQSFNSYSTQTTPDYTWYDDNQTGIFRPVGGAISFTNNGTESVRINSSGNVGIGTTNPTSILSSATLFANSIPKLEVFTGGSTGTYQELMTLRHVPGGVFNTPVLRRLGYIMKMSSDFGPVETVKMGGVILESSYEWANFPSLYLVTGNKKRLGVTYWGDVILPPDPTSQSTSMDKSTFIGSGTTGQLSSLGGSLVILKGITVPSSCCIVVECTFIGRMETTFASTYYHTNKIISLYNVDASGAISQTVTSALATDTIFEAGYSQSSHSSNHEVFPGIITYGTNYIEFSMSCTSTDPYTFDSKVYYQITIV